MEKFNFNDLYERRSSNSSLIDDSDIFRRIKPSVTRREIFHPILLTLVVSSCLLTFIAILLNYESLQRSKSYLKRVTNSFDGNNWSKNATEIAERANRKANNSLRPAKRKFHEKHITKQRNLSKNSARSKMNFESRARRFDQGLEEICDNCVKNFARKTFCCICRSFAQSKTNE